MTQGIAWPLVLFAYTCFFETKINAGNPSGCTQKGSHSSLILKDNCYREQMQTTLIIFSVFVVSFSLSEMCGAQLLLAQDWADALHG